MLRSLVIVSGIAAALVFVGQEKADASKPQTKTTAAATEKKADAPASSSEKKADDAKTKTKTDDAKKPDAKKADEKKADAKKSDSPDAMHKVATEFLKQETTLSGVFEATSMTEVLIRPETWSEFEVLEAVEHGAKVKKGDNLIAFDMKKIDEAIEQAEVANRLSKLALEQADEEHKYYEKTLPLDMRAATRAKEIADEEFQQFMTKDKALAQKSAEFSLKFSKINLENSQEELKQLEKMYRAEDLREESEEIVLKRARDSVEQARFFLEMSQARHEEFTKYTMPRREESVKEQTTRAGLAYEKQKATTPLVASQKKLAQEKAKYDQAKSDEKLAKLKKDRAAMNLTAPTDGVVYYGKSTRGNWSAGSFGTPTDKYQKHQNLRGDEVWMTIVKTRPIFVRTSVSEKDLAGLRTGLSGKATVGALPDHKVHVRIESIAATPLGGSFDCKAAVVSGDDNEQLVPGMTCSVKFVVFQKEALAVPSAMVFTDERDDEKKYVWVKGGDGKPEKKEVEIGKIVGGKTEIVKGLKEGDQIHKEKPSDAK
jgi:HlyD family secretion protein